MNLKDVVRWNTRVSAIYAVGIWTMIGTYGYLKYTGKYEHPPVRTEEEVQDDPNEVVYQTNHSKTVIVYKKDFVPYRTRIYRFFQSLSGEPGRGDE